MDSSLIELFICLFMNMSNLFFIEKWQKLCSCKVCKLIFKRSNYFACQCNILLDLLSQGKSVLISFDFDNLKLWHWFFLTLTWCLFLYKVYNRNQSQSPNIDRYLYMMCLVHTAYQLPLRTQIILHLIVIKQFVFLTVYCH